MKTFIAFAATAGLIALSPAARAVELVGGTVGLEYSSFLGRDSNDLNRAALSGSVELGFSRNFSVQGDLTFANFGYTDLNTTSVALHGIYNASENSSFGAYIGRDDAKGGHINFIGVEAGFTTGAFGGEIYVSGADANDYSSTVYGARGAYQIAPALDLGARFDAFKDDEGNAHRLSVTGAYRVLPEMALTAEIGSAKTQGESGEAFAGIGVNFNFGARQDTAFEKRSIVNLQPGL